MYAERVGSGTSTIMLIHGSVAPGWETWAEQRELADDHVLVVPHRPGYPPNHPVARSDPRGEAAEIAEMVEDGMHLVGHSYGAVVTLLAAALVPDRVVSVTVIEPSAFGAVRGHPAVEALIARMTPVLVDRLQAPRRFLERFLEAVGSPADLPDPLPPELEACARATMAERPPWEADIPFGVLRDAGLPVLVVSGAHSAAFDAACDFVEAELSAQRTVIEGFGHECQAAGRPFNDVLRRFVAA